MPCAAVSPDRVLLVDGPPETRDVLDAVFRPRGVAVDRVRSQRRCDDSTADDSTAEAGGPLRVVVLHDESVPRAAWRNVPRILIARTALDPDATVRRGDSVLPQPYDYGDLVRAIESLLEGRPAA